MSKNTSCIEDLADINPTASNSAYHFAAYNLCGDRNEVSDNYESIAPWN